METAHRSTKDRYFCSKKVVLIIYRMYWTAPIHRKRNAMRKNSRIVFSGESV